MFPYASHGMHGYSLEYCAPLLARAGELAKKYSHRLTTHPGQFTQLGSPKAQVVEASIRELEYHGEMLDRMGIGPDGVIIVHVSSIIVLFMLSHTNLHREVAYMVTKARLLNALNIPSKRYFRGMFAIDSS
jgi:hypothetical protein